MNNINTLIKRLLAGALVAGTIAAAVGVASAANGPGENAAVSPLTNEQAREIRLATNRFHDVDAALAAGYLPTDACAAIPGVGGMGYHYVNPANVMDGVIDPAKPEILLYHVGDDGELKLGGVEYMWTDADQDLATDADRPDLFGQPFDGPMPGHEPGMPVHYDLHVWLFTKNPTGLIAAWNPKVGCPTPEHTDH